MHHIAADGKDGGVVYCEMQGRENSAESRACLALLREIYPNCGYSAETGGIMHNLRTSTTNEKVRNYHSAFYRPENLTLIITGPVSIEDVAKALEPFEKRILSKVIVLMSSSPNHFMSIVNFAYCSQRNRNL